VYTLDSAFGSSRGAAQARQKVLDITNWHEFLHRLQRAGFPGSKMIPSGSSRCDDLRG
jgi:hypothetical protein